MVKKKYKFDRRSFLKLSAATGGGLMLGFNWSSCNSPKDVRPVKVMPKEWYDINAFLKIGDNGLVTIFSPNPEIGQNVKTSMPMIIAEELDVSWEDVVVEQAGLNDWFSRQVAGGSQSIRHGWKSLRMAGATAKRMLVNAAAKEWEIDPSECSVSEGVISNGKGDKLTFGAVAKAASTMDVPKEEDVVLKEAKDYKIIGTDRSNVDIDNIITGKPLFGIDTKREGMLYATVLRPPAFGQKLKSVDDSEALKVAGVKGVYKINLPLRQGPDRTVDKVAVVATSTWAAMKGKKALKAVWQEDTPLENTTNHKADLTRLVNSTAKKSVRKDGDPNKAFAEADEVIEKVFESPFLPHNCMEPMNFFAHVQADKVELVGPVQTPAWSRDRVVKMLGWIDEFDPEDKEAKKAAEEKAYAKVDLKMTRMGGGFGRRLFGDFVMDATQISKVAGAPIQLIWSREDDMAGGTYRPAIHYKLRAAIKDKKITGYHLIEAAVNDNMWASLAQSFPASAIANYQVDNHKIESNITTGAWRAPYTNFLASAEQCFLDEVAQKIGKDPIEMRLELLAEAKKVYDQHAKLEEEIKDEEKLKVAKKGLMPKGNYEPDRFIAAIKMARDKSGWNNKASGSHLGFSAYYSHNTYVAQVAHVTMVDDKPKVDKVTCVVDCGLVINPLAATNLIQGGVIDGIGHAMFGDFGFENGQPSMDNFNQYRLIRMPEAPQIEVHYVNNGKSPTGLGEPTLPPAGAAIANAFHSATGERLYRQPYVKESKVLG